MPPPRIRLAPSLLHTPSSILFRTSTSRNLLRLTYRPASTSSSPNTSNRKSISLTTDTGRIPWSSLTIREKAVRSTQQSFNFLLVLVGIGLTAGVSYVLYLEVFSPSSKTAVFNSVVKRIRSDPRCIDILVGDSLSRADGTKSWSINLNPFGKGSLGSEISAYGEGSWSRWARNRVVASDTEKDRRGTEHMHMHFYVSGPKAEGTVWVHMTRAQGGQWEEYYLALEPKGSGERVVLEDKRGQREQGVKGGKMFGVRWW
ncbi:mitochondrial import inner membrane translocase subunit tim21 [Elsinoe australis]|uniref:Mitochondrial import inner membrane translocase subunit Tim21 n=1 Tax=Elsinoe australis TaxID=40998 RepID=A0A4U7BFY9_9PEZI|nr:mitochondrial import inner membrane translocase subunit tim21 [Elsinoe australis]